jgi:hypothetical protein
MNGSGAKIPVLRLVKHAYLELIGRRRGLIEAGGLWLVLPWVLHTLGGAGVLLGDLALTAGFAAIAVAWHRAILLGERLPKRFAPLTAPVARYLGLSVIIVVLAAAPSMMLALVIAGTVLGTEAPSEPGVLPMLLLIMAAIGSLLAAMRLQIVFPAAAVGERRVGFAVAWASTRGNAWRLLLGVLMVSLPATLIGAALAIGLSSLADATGSLVLGWLARLAPVAGAWIQAPLLAAFLSYAYLFLQPAAQLPVPAEAG